MEKRSISKIIISKLAALAVLLIILIIMNLAASSIQNQLFQEILTLLNQSIVLLILISILLLFAELLSNLGFPLNIPSPLLNALAGVLLVSFIYSLLSKLEFFVGPGTFDVLYSLKNLVYFLVFFLIVAIGYISIISASARSSPREEKVEVRRKVHKRIRRR